MDITKFSQEQLCEAYNVLNHWEWYDGFGEKPSGFDSMIRYRRTFFEKLFRTQSRWDYIHPLCNAIRNIVPKKELLRYHHIHNLGRTNEEFETWWFLESGGCFANGGKTFEYFSRLQER